jgi:hypothetical protein
MNSPLDPRLADYWGNRRMQTLFRGAIADAHKLRLYLLKRQNYRCAITGMPLEDTARTISRLSEGLDRIRWAVEWLWNRSAAFRKAVCRQPITLHIIQVLRDRVDRNPGCHGCSACHLSIFQGELPLQRREYRVKHSLCLKEVPSGIGFVVGKCLWRR